MENKDFDKNIKGLFDGFAPEVDTDELWENVEPHLDKKKKRRFLFVWFFFGLAGISWLFFSTDSAIDNPPMAIQSEENRMLEPIQKEEPSIVEKTTVLDENQEPNNFANSQDLQNLNLPKTPIFSTKKTKGTLKQKNENSNLVLENQLVEKGDLDLKTEVERTAVFENEKAEELPDIENFSNEIIDSSSEVESIEVVDNQEVTELEVEKSEENLKRSKKEKI